MADSKVIRLTDENFDAEVAKGVVLVDVWAPWCSPCMVQGPIVEKLSETIGDKVRVAKLNVDEGQRVAARFGVQGIPTLLLLKNGEEVKRFVGLQTEAHLRAAMEEVLRD